MPYQVSSAGLLPFATLTGTSPGSIFNLGQIFTTDTFKIVVSWTGVDPMDVVLNKYTDTYAILPPVTGQGSSGPKSVIIERPANVDAILYVEVSSPGFG